MEEAKVNIDYHIQADKHLYSVPYRLIHQQVDVRLTGQTVEIFIRRQRVAAHRRSYVKGRYTTDPAHMPEAHRKHLEWDTGTADQLGAEDRRSLRTGGKSHS